MFSSSNISIFLLSILCVVQFARGVEIREYNTVQYRVFDSVHDFENTFVDESGKITENVVVGVYGHEECRSWVESPNLMGVQRMSGVANLRYATIHTTDFPGGGLDPCAEVLFYKVGTTITTPFARTIDLDYVSLNEFISAHVLPCEMFLFNEFPFPVTLVWHDESQEPSIQMSLRSGPHGRPEHMNSFLGHLFSVHQGVNNGKSEDIVDFFIAGGKNVVIGPEHRQGNCIDIDIPYFGGLVGTDHIEHRLGECSDADNGADTGISSDFDRQCVAPDASVPPHNSTHFFGFFSERPIACSDMASRFQEYSHSLYHEKRLALNFVSPQVIRPVTRDGFRKLRLPEDTHSWLKKWFLDERARLNMDIESDSGPCMNQFAAPTVMTHLTPGLKDKLSDELYPILHNWFISNSYYDGQVVAPEDRPEDTYERMMGWNARNTGELVLTSIYGVRRYHNGSVLRMHVDTANTHVISAIINVNQEEMAEGKDWPLLILDHEYREHWISMQPGDLVLYESAKLLHGRPTTFNGGAYDNIFIHYMPEDEDSWDYNWI